MRYAQFVVGAVGSDKPTYRSTMQRQAANDNEVIRIVNLNPAVEYFNYEQMVKIRESIQPDDATEDPELKFWSNGALAFCKDEEEDFKMRGFDDPAKDDDED